MGTNLTYLSSIKGWENTNSVWASNSGFLMSNQSGMILLSYDKSLLIDKTHNETAKYIEENKSYDNEISAIESEANPILKQRKIVDLRKKMSQNTFNQEQYEFLKERASRYSDNVEKLDNEFTKESENVNLEAPPKTLTKINDFIKSGEYNKDNVDKFVADISNNEPQISSEDISGHIFATIKNRAMTEIMSGMAHYYSKSAEIYALRQNNKHIDKLNNIEIDNINTYKEEQLNSDFAKDREPYHDPLSHEGNVWHTNNATTNCFAYAANDPLGHISKPSPGEKSGVDLKSCSGLHVASLATNDGFVPAKLDENRLPIQKKGFYLVALVSDRDDKDYHWYRQNQDGTWSHKIGNRLPKNQDESGKPIIDVETADRGSYTEFVGYFYVPKGGIAIGKKAQNSFETNLELKNKLFSNAR